MTVKELIAVLEKYPAEFPVHTRMGTSGFSVTGVKQGADHGVAVAELTTLPHDEPPKPAVKAEEPHKKHLGKK